MICAFILEKYIKFFGMPIFIGSEAFQMVHFQYFHNDTAEPPTPAISQFFGTVELQSIHDYSSWWVLRTGLEREKAERLLEWRKTFRTVHFSSNKILVRSA